MRLLENARRFERWRFYVPYECLVLSCVESPWAEIPGRVETEETEKCFSPSHGSFLFVLAIAVPIGVRSFIENRADPVDGVVFVLVDGNHRSVFAYAV